jgi:hypothetical protein
LGNYELYGLVHKPYSSRRKILEPTKNKEREMMTEMVFEYLMTNSYSHFLFWVFVSVLFFMHFRLRRKIINLSVDYHRLAKMQEVSDIKSEKMLQSMNDMQQSMSRLESTLSILVKLITEKK